MTDRAKLFLNPTQSALLISALKTAILKAEQEGEDLLASRLYGLKHMLSSAPGSYDSRRQALVMALETTPNRMTDVKIDALQKVFKIMDRSEEKENRLINILNTEIAIL